MLMNFTHEKLLDKGVRAGVSYDVFLDQTEAIVYGSLVWSMYSDIQRLTVQHDSRDKWYEVVYDYPLRRLM